MSKKMVAIVLNTGFYTAGAPILADKLKDWAKQNDAELVATHQLSDEDVNEILSKRREEGESITQENYREHSFKLITDKMLELAAANECTNVLVENRHFMNSDITEFCGTLKGKGVTLFDVNHGSAPKC